MVWQSAKEIKVLSLEIREIGPLVRDSHFIEQYQRNEMFFANTIIFIYWTLIIVFSSELNFILLVKQLYSVQQHFKKS